MQDENLRTKRIEIRLTASEKSRLKKIIMSSEFSTVAAIFRDRVLNESGFSFGKVPCTKRKKIFIQQDPELTKSVAQIGNNINQLTKHVNTICKRGERFAAIELYAILINIHSKLELLIKTKSDD